MRKKVNQCAKLIYYPMDFTRKLITSLKANTLLSGSLIMIIGSFFTSSVNYSYHLVMGRLLGPVIYGEVASLISLIGLLAIIPTTLGIVATKMVSESKNSGEIIGVSKALNKLVVILGIFFLVLMMALSPIISSFLKINNILLIIISIVVFILSFPAVLTRSILQGLLKFPQAVLSQLTENGFRLGVAIALVLIGLSSTGALLGLVVGTALSWLLAAYFIKGYLAKNKSSSVEKSFSFRKISIIILPVFLLSISFISLYSTDLLLVKHFFPSYQAGLYAALSFLGRIIFFGVSPITAVMFPMVSKYHSQGENYRKIIFLSLLGAVILSFLITFIYALIPEFTINLLYGSDYLSSSPLLIWFGIAMSFMTISFLLSNYSLAIGKPKAIIFPILAAVTQILGIILFHQTISSVIIVTLISCFFLLLCLLYYLFTKVSKND